jgi:PIN domain nuclease of toxin-antitoxin system
LLDHIYTLQRLPFHHNDPFDRLIIAQASAENMSLVSADHRLSQYDIKIIW